jgi:hypothetical protein
MNRIARTIANTVVATGLAAGVLTLGATAAHAETPPAPKPGPVLGQPKPGIDPIGPFDASPVPPAPKPPKPGPKDLGVVPPEPVIDPKPEAPKPPKTDSPQTPGAPQTEAPDQGCFTGCDLPELPVPATETETAPVTPQGGPSFVINGDESDAAPATETAPVESEDAAELIWLLAGAGVLAAGGVILVVRRRTRQADQA